MSEEVVGHREDFHQPWVPLRWGTRCTVTNSHPQAPLSGKQQLGSPGFRLLQLEPQE